MALLALALRRNNPGAPGRSSLLRTAGWCWVGGVVVFSGSLYALALGGPHWLGPVTPLGGILLLAGWGSVIASSIKDTEGAPE